MTEKQYEAELAKANKANKEIEMELHLKEVRSKYARKKLTASKIIMLVVFLMCIEILVFSELAMLITGDLSALYTLIGVPVTLVPIVLGYLNKSKAENCSGGVTYLQAMSDLSIQEPEDNNDIADIGEEEEDDD